MGTDLFPRLPPGADGLLFPYTPFKGRKLNFILQLIVLACVHLIKLLEQVVLGGGGAGIAVAGVAACAELTGSSLLLY